MLLITSVVKFVRIMEYVDSALDFSLDFSESFRTQLITDEELDDDNKELFELIRYHQHVDYCLESVRIFPYLDNNFSRESVLHSFVTIFHEAFYHQDQKLYSSQLLS